MQKRKLRSLLSRGPPWDPSYSHLFGRATTDGSTDSTNIVYTQALPIRETRHTFCRTRSLSNATFSFLITLRSSSLKSAAVYKFYRNRMIFHCMRYGDISISKWRPSAILELFYHHTRPPTKSLLLAAASCQISRQSDIQIWRYSYSNFSYIWLEMPIQAPKIGILGDFGLDP